MEQAFDQSLEELMADPRLVELCELQRTGDEVLDVIRLSENQHSDILAWMLDAKEGHGQGDEILRDLLMAASSRAAAGESGLDGRLATARFFADWPPSRIRTTSFGSAFTARELGMTAKERVDLFVIDAQNKFVLLVENKAGALHDAEQLDGYRTSFTEVVRGNPRLREFDIAYIALDREFDEDIEDRPSSRAWLHLGYSWLETSARRALMHVGRGNAAARLVVSYCNRQTEWRNPDDDKCLQLAASLHQSHPDAVKRLINLSQGRAEKEWLASGNRSDSALIFRLQNRGAVSILSETQGMASLMSAMQARLPTLPKDHFENSRVWLNVCPSELRRSHDECWPVYFRVTYADSTKSKYVIALCWYAPNARSDAEAEDLRRRLTKVDSKFGKHGQSKWRRVVLGAGLTTQELMDLLVKCDKELTAALLAELSVE